MRLDQYTLWPLLSNGAEVPVEYEGATYLFKFCGNKIGSENYLLVKNPEGEEKKFGWGWDGQQISQALDHLKQGWNTEQRPPFRPYNWGRGLPD